MADNTKKVSSIVPKRGSRKKVAALIRQESFNHAYPKKGEEPQSPVIEQTEQSDMQQKTVEQHSAERHSAELPVSVDTPKNQEEKSESRQENLAEQKPTTDEEEKTVSKATGTTSKKGGKGKNKYEYDYTTIAVDSPTAMAVQIASKMIQEKQNEFTKIAIRERLKSLIKKGKIYDLPFFDI